MAPTSNRLVLVIPDPPVAKARPRVTFKNGGAHAYTPTKTADAEERIQRWAMAAMLSEGRPKRRPLFTGPVSLHLVVWLRPPKSIPKSRIATALPDRRPDLDNYEKLAVDALGRAGVWRDDAQIVDCTTSKRYTWGLQPRWEITIEQLEAA